MFVGEFYIETCRGEDAKHRVSTTQTSSLILEIYLLIPVHISAVHIV